MQPRYATFYKPIVKGYTAPLILIGALNGMFGVYLLFAVPYDKISDVEALIFAVITLVVLHKFYKEVYNVERRYRALDELELVRVFVEDAQELQSARVSVCCWRLGWLGWVVEVLIYAGLSLALWLAVGRGEIAWGLWWVAIGAALLVAALRTAERLAPRWIPFGRAEAWAWGVRAARLAVAAVACVMLI